MAKALDIQQNDRAVAKLRHALATQFDGNISAPAKAIGVSGPAISDVLNSKRGAGMKVLRGLARVTGVSVDELVTGRPSAALAGYETLASHPSWPKARAEALKRLARFRPELAEASVDRVSRFAMPDVPVVLTGLFVASLAEAIIAEPLEP
jgi:transcriptional regulator with XRE-family HTH domain